MRRNGSGWLSRGGSLMSRRIALLLAAVLVAFGLLGLLTPEALAQNPVPFVNLPLVPDAVAPGGPDFTLTVNGAGFVSSSVVDWNGNALATQFIGVSQLTATVPAADIATASTASVTVVNPAPGGGRSNTAWFAVTAPVSTVTFTLASSPTTGGSPVAVGDFNGDGNLDLVALSQFDISNNICILLGDGSGNFTLAWSLAAPDFFPVGAAIGDFNGDGKLDLAVSGSLGGVDILIGDGTGNLTLSSALSTGPSLSGVAVGDFNGDGNLDLAVAGWGLPAGDLDGWVSIWLGDGTGNFTPTYNAPLVGWPTSLAVGDFNRDGKLDLAVTNQEGYNCERGDCTYGNSDTVDILLGDGTGKFTLSSPLATDLFASSVQVADFNGDGKLDLLVGTQGNAAGGVWLGDGTGKFTFLGGLFQGEMSDVVGDFTGENKLDVLTYWGLCLGNGDGTFGDPIAEGTDLLSPLVAGDFNDDGKLDVVTSAGGTGPGGEVDIWLQPSPAILLSPSSLSFANQGDNTTSAKQTLTVSNTGNASLAIVSIGVTGDFAQTNTCGTSIAAGASCTITVTFTPTAPGSRTGTISINDDAPHGPHVVDLTGTGEGPVVALSPPSISVGDQNVGTASAIETATLTNSGGGALTITSISVSGDFSETNTCGNSVAAGTSCTINITFTPTAPGTRTGAITITDNAPGSPHVVTLTGTGMGPAVSFSASTMSVGGEIVGNTSAAHTVTLTNSGNDALTITGMTVSPSSFSETNTCKSSLAAGASCTITVTFTPSVAGKFNGMLSVADNAPGSPHQVTLSGMGQDFAIGPYNLSQTIPAGMTTAYDLKVKPLGEFNQTVSLACSGAPAQSRCSVSPTSVTLDGRNYAVIELKVTTERASSAPPARNRPLGLPGSRIALLAEMGALLLALTVMLNRVRARSFAGLRPRIMASLGTLLLLTIAWIACGGGPAFVFTPPSGGTPAGSYVVTVTATSGHLSHAITVKLAVD